MHPAFIFAVAFLPLALGTSNTTASSSIQIEAIEANFQNSGLVPSLLTSFNPAGLLNVSFPAVGVIQPGTPLTQDDVNTMPNLTVAFVNTSITGTGNYTLMMVDAGPVGTDESQGQTRHWLVNSLEISASDSPVNISGTSGTIITAYAGPAPAQGSGPHRYAILVYSQPPDFSPPANLSQPGVPVSVFNLADYVQSSNLGPVIAGMYFTVEVGAATFTPSATSPVITSTLLPSITQSLSGSSTSTQTGLSKSGQSSSASNLALASGSFSVAVSLVLSCLFNFA